MGMAPNDAVHQYWQEVYDNLTTTPAAGAASELSFLQNLLACALFMSERHEWGFQ